MNHPCKTVSLIAFVALLSAGPAFTQTPSTEATPEAKADAPVAYVYVQTLKGINLYDAAADGKLTLVKGSPFANVGQMEAVNGKYLVSLGTDYIHTYKIEPNGAPGKQASEINTQNYTGAECGNTTGGGAVLDHTGQNLYIQLNDAQTIYREPVCVAWQSYKISSDGALTYLGTAMDGPPTEYNGTTVPTFSGNDNFAYGRYIGDTNPFALFSRSKDGLISVTQNFASVDPVAPNPSDSYLPYATATDPTHHLAAELYPNASQWPPPPPQLASYTISDADGSIVSTNTWEDMPTFEVTHANGIRMSPSGKLLAVFGFTGLQIFHFNGADPLTRYSSLLLPTIEISQLAWDNDNHLYAFSIETCTNVCDPMGELYVYTITPTSISQASGSPYKVENANVTVQQQGLIVVPKL